MNPIKTVESEQELEAIRADMQEADLVLDDGQRQNIPVELRHICKCNNYGEDGR